MITFMSFVNELCLEHFLKGSPLLQGFTQSHKHHSTETNKIKTALRMPDVMFIFIWDALCAG